MPFPTGKQVVGYHWIFKTKLNLNGTIERYKAQLIAQGFSYKFRIDYKETFAHVAKMTTVRVLLSIVINHGSSLY